MVTSQPSLSSPCSGHLKVKSWTVPFCLVCLSMAVTSPCLRFGPGLKVLDLVVTECPAVLGRWRDGLGRVGQDGWTTVGLGWDVPLLESVR